MNEGLIQKQQAHFKHMFTRADRHTTAAIESLQKLIEQLRVIVAGEGVVVDCKIHTPMISDGQWKNILTEVTFTAPKALQKAEVQFIYSASMGTEVTSFAVTAMLDHRFDDILRGQNTGQVIEDQEMISSLLKAIAVRLWGFRIS
jgi:hypothetical protein